MSTEETGKFEGWAILELMGHRRLAGYVREQEIAGQAFLRLDIPGSEPSVPGVTQFYGAASIYCLTPTTEDIARKVGARSRPAPVQLFELEPPRVPTASAVRDDPEYDTWGNGDEI